MLAKVTFPTTNDGKVLTLEVQWKLSVSDFLPILGINYQWAVSGIPDGNWREDYHLDTDGNVTGGTYRTITDVEGRPKNTAIELKYKAS